MRTLRHVVCSALLLAIFIAPAGAALKPTGTPVTIGAILSITGPYAPLGEPERNGIQIAVADVNATGGINGHPLQVTILDDESKADTAQQLATQLVGQKVAAIIGGSLSPTSEAIARVANDAKILQMYMTPTLSVWQTKAGIRKYTFEATPHNELEVTKLFTFMKNTLHTQKLAVLHDDQLYGTQGTLVAEAEAKAQNVPIVDEESYAVTATDVTPQLQKVKAAGADTILIYTAAPSAGILVRQVHQFGMKAHLIGTTGIVSDNFLKVTGADGDGVYADMDLDRTYPNAVQKKLLAAYRSAYNAGANNFASFAWDAVHLVAYALRTAKSTDGDKLVAALENMQPYSGTTGTYKFTATDHNGFNAQDIRIVIDHDGVWETLAKQ
ncbi:MAG TPA: ABC transporter substrate-binding protein [Candidatus Lustribacter sp.]|nr:ABC transporter substrate-binding protein [Candidatus Lustribacter sp.]